MKSITHYFSEPSASEAATMEFSVEVRSERGKAAARKRERVKIKITGANSKSVECKLVENKLDLVDKTPSPLCNGRRPPGNDETPRTKKAVQAKENIVKETECIDVDSDEPQILDVPEKKVAQKNRKVKEKLVALANKKGMETRKRKERDEEDEMNDLVQEKKKLFTQASKKDYSNGENIIVDQRRSSCSLLNYFSKATPEQIQKEKIAMTKMIVKADIHQVDENQLTPKVYVLPKNKIRPKKRSSDTDSILSTADEIEVLSSENISPPPSPLCNGSSEPVVKQDSPFTSKGNKTTKDKPKWSMKIKLNSTEDEKKNGDSIVISDDEMYTPQIRKKARPIGSTKAESKSPESIIKDKNKVNKKEKALKNESDVPHQTVSKSPKSSKSESLKAKKTDVKSSKEENKGPKQSSPKSMPAPKLAPIFMRKNSTKETENDVVVLEDSLKRKPTEKLASLFIKRPKPDPEVVAARRKFLQPDFPDPDRLVTQKNVFPPPALFPKISHVTQLDETVRTEPQLKFNYKKKTKYTQCINVAEIKTVNCHDEITDVPENQTESMTDQEREEAVKELESRGEYATKIWQRISKLSQFQKERKNGAEVKETKKKKRGRPKKNAPLDESVNVVEEEDPLKGLVWTSKYRPRCSADVIGNEQAVTKLKEWLEAWKSTDDNNDSDSDDDFYHSNSNELLLNGKKCMAVLMGPHGCGKTSSVYAIAEELGYKVIEVNASSKRPGRNILKNLEEATKSHRIRNHSMESFGFGTKNGIEEKLAPTKTLILLDDIDLVFEEDDGFVNAVYQLASNTKRPIAMTCKHSFSQSSKFAPQVLRISFDAVPYKKASLFLELVALAETRHKLPISCAEALLLTGDLRKALLQLQYLVLSNRATTPSAVENVLPSLWKETHQKLYRPIIKAEKKKKKSQEKETENAPAGSKIDDKVLEDLAFNVDSISLMANLSNQRDFALEEEEHFAQDSLSLAENTSDYRHMDKLSSEICEWIKHSTFSRNSWEAKDVTSVESLIQKKRMNRGVNMALMPTVATTLDRRAMSTDLLPYVRAICRSEEIRQQSNAKRTNRFYHYMQGIVTARPHSFTAACRMFQEKSKDKT